MISCQIARRETQEHFLKISRILENKFNSCKGSQRKLKVQKIVIEFSKVVRYL